MEKLSQFGVEPLLLAAQIVNFLILVFILKRFLYKPLLSIIKKREEKIKDGLAAGVKGEEFLVKAREEEKEILHRANKEAKLMMEEAGKRMSTFEEEMRAKMKEESQSMLKQTQKRILQEEEETIKRLEGRSVDIASRLVEKVLGKVLTKQDQAKIMASSVKMLKKEVS